MIDKIQNRDFNVGIIGLGYVGLPLLIEFAKENFYVSGYDIDDKKISKLNDGETYIKHIDAEHIKEHVTDNPRANVTSDFSLISKSDAILICVPTPLTQHREPDLSYIESTAERIGPYIRKEQLIVLESTTYPGTTEDVLIPILEEISELKAGEDFYVAYSPEREDPNNKNFSTKTIPKVVGGYSDTCSEIANALYSTTICETVPVPNCRTAEATKLMENIFRSVNIALVNELKVVFKEMDIDIWDVVNAAKTKPFGYMPFYPGPGLGGHCIPIDPFYLTWKAKEYGLSTKFIELAGEINTHMPDYVVTQSLLALNEHGKAINGSKVILIGLSYKKNVDDDRESPTYVLWDKLEKLGAKISYHDPYCPEVRPSRKHSHLSGIKSESFENITSENYDMAIVSTAHDSIDFDQLSKQMNLIVDCRNACDKGSNIYKS